jgi:excisionase family DNA binding protein
MDGHIQEYLSIAEVAQVTSLSVAFWRKAVLRRRIAFLKLGRRVVIRRSDLERWIAVEWFRRRKSKIPALESTR